MINSFLFIKFLCKCSFFLQEITKRIENDQFEIVTKWRALQVRTATVIEEDDVEISRTFHRRVLHPSRTSYDSETKKYTHTDTDLSGEPKEIQDICAAIWTDEVKAAFKEEQKKFCGPGAPGDPA